MALHVKILLVLISLAFGAAAAVFRFMAALYDDAQKDVHAERHRDFFRRWADHLKRAAWVGVIRGVSRFFVSLPDQLPTRITVILSDKTRFQSLPDRLLSNYLGAVTLSTIMVIGPALAFYISGVAVGAIVFVFAAFWMLLIAYSVIRHRHQFRGVAIIGPLMIYYWVIILIEGARLPFVYLPLYALALFPIFLNGASDGVGILFAVLTMPYWLIRGLPDYDDDDDDDDEEKVRRLPSYLLAPFWLIVSYFLMGVFITTGQTTFHETVLKPSLQMLIANALCDSISLTATISILSLALRTKKITVTLLAFLGNLLSSGALGIVSVYLAVLGTTSELSLAQCWYVFIGHGQTHGVIGAFEYQCLMYTTFALIFVYTIAIIVMSFAKAFVDLADWLVGRLILNNKPLALMSAIAAIIAFTAGSGATLIGSFYGK